MMAKVGRVPIVTSLCAVIVTRGWNSSAALRHAVLCGFQLDVE